MKDYVIEFSEKVYFRTVIQAESEEQARELFLSGEWNDCEEFDREFDPGEPLGLYEE